MKKIALLSLALILALGTLGVGYALWSENLYIEGYAETGELDWEFAEPPEPGNPSWLPPIVTHRDVGPDPLMQAFGGPYGKDVAETLWWFTDEDGDGDMDTLHVQINNAYPGYYNNLSLHVHNNGTIPLHFEEIRLNGNLWDGEQIITDGGALAYWWGDPPYGEQIHPCSGIEISFFVYVLQPAIQDHTYSFDITLTGVNYNESQFP